MKIYIIGKKSCSGAIYIWAVTTSKKNAKFLIENYSTEEERKSLKIIEYQDYSKLTPEKGVLCKAFVFCDNNGNVVFCDADQEYYLGEECVVNKLMCKENIPERIDKIEKNGQTEYIFYVVEENEELACEKAKIFLMEKQKVKNF